MDYKEAIAALITRVLREHPFEMDCASSTVFGWLEVPKDSKMGDWAFPCFLLAKQLRKSPAAIASDMLEKLLTVIPSDRFSAVEATGPYLNFKIDKAFLAAELLPSILSGEYLAKRKNTGQRVMIEYSQPNTHKAFHVGHMRNLALGNAMVRISEWAGNHVIAANYIGDVGAHIAKCLWYLKSFYKGSIPSTQKGEFLGKMYSNAVELLDFKRLSSMPYIDVVTAKVISIEKHPQADGLQVVVLNDGSALNKTIVCGGVGYDVGNTIAYALPGSRIGGRLVTVADKQGISSDGMVCSEKEIGASNNRDKIYVFNASVQLGLQIAELTRIDGALDSTQSVIAEMQKRSDGVRQVLQALEAKEPEMTQLWETTRQWSMDEFTQIYDWTAARFDHVFYESDVGDSGKRLVKDFYDKGVFIQSEGAIGADLSDFNLPFFLLLKSDGTGLYSTKDLALAQLKFDRFKIDRSIYVVDYTQSLHFEQVFKCLSLMGYKRAEHCVHLAYGMVTVPGGKMSSREGNVILFSDLKERLTQKVRTDFLQDKDWSETEIDTAARCVAIATINYGMLNQDPKRNIVFDMDEWTAKTGNTGPYLMYAYTRIQSILAKIDQRQTDLADYRCLNHEFEENLIRQLTLFPQIVLQANELGAPNMICSYLYDLARQFSRMYEYCPVTGAANKPLKEARVALIDAVGHVLKQGLGLIGIETLERM